MPTTPRGGGTKLPYPTAREQRHDNARQRTARKTGALGAFECLVDATTSPSLVDVKTQVLVGGVRCCICTHVLPEPLQHSMRIAHTARTTRRFTTVSGSGGAPRAGGGAVQRAAAQATPRLRRGQWAAAAQAPLPGARRAARGAWTLCARTRGCATTVRARQQRAPRRRCSPLRRARPSAHARAMSRAATTRTRAASAPPPMPGATSEHPATTAAASPLLCAATARTHAQGSAWGGSHGTKEPNTREH